jgi:hypothetical protein
MQNEDGKLFSDGYNKTKYRDYCNRNSLRKPNTETTVTGTPLRKPNTEVTQTSVKEKKKMKC